MIFAPSHWDKFKKSSVCPPELTPPLIAGIRHLGAADLPGLFHVGVAPRSLTELLLPSHSGTMRHGVTPALAGGFIASFAFSTPSPAGAREITITLLIKIYLSL